MIGPSVVSLGLSSSEQVHPLRGLGFSLCGMIT